MTSIGQVFAVDTKAPVYGLIPPMELMALYPCVYGRDGSPDDGTHYLAIVLVRSETEVLSSDVMRELRGYCPFCAHYLTHFYREV